MSTIIKNGTIITASDTVTADVLIEGEKVVLIGQKLPTAGHQVIDAKGKYLLPGGHRCPHPSRHALWRHNLVR